VRSAGRPCEHGSAYSDAHLIRSDGASRRCRLRKLAHAPSSALARLLGVALRCIRPSGDLLRRNDGAVLLMCGVFGVVLPGGEPNDAASIAALGSSRSTCGRIGRLAVSAAAADATGPA
jgi:hypothetical protein